MIRAAWLLLLVSGCALTVGCEKSGRTLLPVSGKVTYSDGSAPQGETRTIHFEPASQSTGQIDVMSKGAHGNLADDGTYTLMTVDPNDGALPGDYKVTFTIKKSYTGDAKDTLVAAKYMSIQTTPHAASVQQGQANKFDFVIEKP